MSVVPLKRFLVELTDFETEAEVARPSSAAQGAESAHYAADREAELEAAVARGREEAEAEASSAIEQLEREHETRLAATLAAERARWVMTESAKMAGLLSMQLDELRREFGELVTRILKPFLTDALREKAVAELRRTILEAVAGNGGVEFAISGPADLTGQVRSLLADKSIPVAVTETSAIDVRVKIDQMLVETNLAAWVNAIERAEA
jgi:flagellar biosynthesis/type III secretory pathway protein FliH